MASDCFGLLWDLNGELEQLPKVLKLFDLNIRVLRSTRVEANIDSKVDKGARDP